ncbi:nitroreductase family protein [Oerskovia sp. M15]
MSTETFTPIDAAFDDLLEIDASTADLLFREARTVHAFEDEAVPDEKIQAAYDLVRWGPTAMNTVPLRLLVVRSPRPVRAWSSTWRTATRPRRSRPR